ncbi:MAG TPA: gliding motility-associated C-terminal domain-containing protein [Leadbetterella sp.]|nr:gliding motility-associated C-terminal domain-containing protein [Leadbetterella sp.]
MFTLRFIWVLACLVVSSTSIGQNICQTLPTNAIAGNFDIAGNLLSGCSPLQIDLIDKSGGINVKYEFYYSAQSPADLKKNGNDDLSNVYFTSTTTKTFTILQYGEKNGKPMYACKNVTVFPNNKPKFSYSICSSALEIVIPRANENNFDSYKINWGSGNSEVTIMANQLPYSASKPVNYPTQIKVEGVYNTQSNVSCGATGTITIQKLDPVNFPNGYNPPFDPNIDEIVNAGGKQLTLKIKGSEDGQGYNLNMRKLTGVYPSNAFMTNVIPSNLNVTLPDSEQVYCFYLTRISGCGSFEESSEVCNLVQETPKINPGNVSLQWSTYPNANRDYTFQPALHSFNKKIEIEKDINGTKTFVTVQNNTTNFLDQIECVANLKYRIKVTTEGLLWGYQFKNVSYSDWEYIDASKIKAPTVSEVMVTANDNNKIQIDFKNNNTWNTPILRYYIHEITNNVAQLIDSVLVPTLYITNKDAALQTYCFALSYVDQCGISSVLSPEVCSLNLKLANNNVLEWALANPFVPGDIMDLVLENKKNEMAVFSNPTLLLNNQTSYIPDYSGFTDKAFFRLKASKDNYISYSNALEVPLKTSLIFPNTFSPNDDGINDSYYPLGAINRISNYTMMIYNRWGEIIFETKNPLEKWDGKNKLDKPYLAGIYFVKVNYQNEKMATEELNIPLLITK